MKKYSDELHQLIINLTLSEKRYCSLYLKKHAAEDGNRYLLLFNHLRKQDSYESATAIAVVGFESRPAHYSVLKKQLYEQLLDALHQFDLFTNPEQQLLRGIHQCQLLLQKGLFVQCEKRINALSKTAVDMNHFEAQLLLQNLQMAMKARKYFRQVDEQELRNWKAATDDAIKQLATANTYRYESSLIYKVQYDTGARGKELANRMQGIVSQPMFQDEKIATNLRAQLDFYQVNALYHFTNLAPAKAFEYNEKFLSLLDTNPLMQQLYADRYFSVLNNYLIDCLLLKKYDLLEEGLVKLRNLQTIAAFKRLVNFSANVFRLSYLLELNYRVATGSFAEAYQNISGVTAGLQKHADKVVKHNRFTLQYLMAYVCFALGRFDESLQQLWPILQEKETAVAEDVQMAARMMQLLCHFEKDDKMLLESLVKSIRRLLRKDASVDMQRAVVSFVQASVGKTKIANEKWLELSAKIHELAQNPTLTGSLNLFNYSVWAEAHAGQKTFAETWKKRTEH